MPISNSNTYNYGIKEVSLKLNELIINQCNNIPNQEDLKISRKVARLIYLNMVDFHSYITILDNIKK
jgi:hypothetical protein